MRWEFDMQKWKRIGREEGRAENIIENIRSLMQTLNLTAENAMDALKIPPQEHEKILAAIYKVQKKRLVSQMTD